MDLSDVGQQPEINKISANDLVGKMMQAHSSQRLGNVSQALEIYKEVISLDPNGVCGQSALEAVHEIHNSSRASNLLLPAEPPTHKNRTNIARTPYREHRHRDLLFRWVLNLSISKKYLLILLTSELLFLALAGIGSQLIRNGLKTQLFNQAKSELAVLEINYNIKIDQMAVGFQAQADNAAIINLANTPAQFRNSIGYFQLQSQVKQILLHQLLTLKIEYSTLVGKDLRIIADANVQQGEIFNPNNLVAEVLSDPRQVKASEIVGAAELALSGSQLPFDFANQDALIRYTVTPVRDPATLAVIGALVSGDIVNGKLLIPEETVKAFGEGYSAVYLREPGGEFALATAFAKTNASAPPRRNDPLPNSSLIAAAAAANGEPVTSEALINGQTYALAAKSLPITFKKVANGWLPNYSASPVAILVRGTPESTITALVGDSLNKLALSSVVLISASVLLDLQLGRLITKPIKHLQEITKNFSQGDRRARAEVEGTDEVGQLAIAFNQMADNIQSSEVALREHGLSELRLIEQARFHEIQAQIQREANERQAQKIIEFLLEIENAKAGDLTVQADVSGDEIGAIADAFNATIIYFRHTILSAQAILKKAEEFLENNGCDFDNIILTQHNYIAQLQAEVKKVSVSVQSAANFASQSLAVSQSTSNSINQVANGSDKIKAIAGDIVYKTSNLHDSYQEMSRSINIISGISEKINILALNASIEAVKAGGDNSESLRVIAEDIRSFAAQLVDSTKTIESLVNSIQSQLLEDLQSIQTGKSEIDSDSRLLEGAKPELEEIVRLNHNIISILQPVVDAPPSQHNLSQQINDPLRKVEPCLSSSFSEAYKFTSIRNNLSAQIQKLQVIFSKFRVDK